MNAGGVAAAVVGGIGRVLVLVNRKRRAGPGV